MKIENFKLSRPSGIPRAAGKISQRGFTLIELLIVIALLGALAVGLLATVDPFEQLKKGTDTSLRNTTAEIYNSAIRYYSVKTTFPWTADIVAMPLNDTAMVDTSSGYLYAIIRAGELKPEFVQLAGSGNLGQIRLTSTEDVNQARQNVSVCFLPASKSFANESNAKYASDGLETTGCVSTESGGASCYWCIK